MKNREVINGHELVAVRTPLVGVHPRLCSEPLDGLGERRCSRRATTQVLAGDGPLMCHQHARVFARLIVKGQS